jgi:uncharacterized membrane protein YbhN (UPF0104 family)
MFSQFLTHAGIYIGLATLILGGLVLYNPRLMMQDYPPAIKDVLPPKTEKEKKLSIWLGMPFLILLLVFPIYATFIFQAQSQGTAGFLQLVLYGFGITFAFNLWDWLVLDWLIFCTITPRQMVIAGSEGNPGYKDYAFHFRGFLIGTIFSLVMGLIAASIVVLAA